jgi:glycine cleavage system H lipoate-binding protein
MSLGWVLAILLLMLVIFYFLRRQGAQVAAIMQSEPPRPHPQPVSGIELPSGYCFHPGHTWMAQEEKAKARVGMDGFAANLLGCLQHMTVIGEQRWVRQGQKLMTVTGEYETVELLSPLEGVVAAINPEVIKDPGLAARDPYGEGWVCQIKPPEIEANQRNLIQGPLAARWMENCFKQLKSMLAEVDPALAQDGGLPLRGALSRLSPEGRKRMVKEFFLG